MSVSYSLSERVNAQTLIWAVGGALWRLWAILRTVGRVIATSEPYVMGAFVITGYALLMFAGVSALVSMIPATFWLGLVVTGAFAYVTYPRCKARPARCPYCQSSDIDAGRGWAECRDCGKTWSF